jgi:hypothetical protein
MGRVLHTGQAIVDLVMRVPAMPPVGGDIYAHQFELTAGGGFNVMAAAARDSADVVYLGTVGTGPFGDKVHAALQAERIAAPNPPVADLDTGVSVAIVDADAEEFEWAVGVAGVAAEAGGDADGPGEFQGADREVAAGGHCAWRVAGPQLGGVLGEGGVADVVQGLDLPVSLDQLRELGGRGLFGGEAGDRVDGLDRGPAGLAVGAPSLDLNGLPGSRNSRLFTVPTLIRRISERPWPMPRVRPCKGMSFQGRDLSCLRSFLVLPLTITM